MSINLTDVTYVYMPKTPFERVALNNVTLEIPEGKITAIAGHTGSGKSTLIQQLNGLLQPAQGTVTVDGVNINDKKNPLAKQAKLSVGMVFQYPEQQLFEETVEDDIAFGPKNLGLSAEEVTKRVKKAMDFVNLDYDKYAQRSPFQLSGGQMRRVAIAGIVTMEPKYLVLDEPVAGLDPRSREDLLQKIEQIYKKYNISIVLVSHNMEDIARLAHKVIVMRQGKVLLEGSPAQVFSEAEDILSAGLLPPQTTIIMDALKNAGLPVNGSAYTVDEGVKLIAEAVRRKKGC